MESIVVAIMIYFKQFKKLFIHTCSMYTFVTFCNDLRSFTLTMSKSLNVQVLSDPNMKNDGFVEEQFIVEVPQIIKEKSKHGRENVIWKARQSYDLGRCNSIQFRKKQLKQLKLMYKEHELDMMEALKLDLGKAEMESSIFEIEFLKNDLTNVISNFESWLRPQNTYKRLMDFFGRPQIYKDAYGVVLIVGAWNYPLQSTLLPLASAIAAGNCVVLKPPAEVKHTTKFLQDTLPAYLDHLSYFLIDSVDDYNDFKFDYIFYTGPLQEAKRLHLLSSKYLTPGTYIIGGKNPVYVDETANLHLAVKRILWGKCVNAGQTCIGPGYILCTKEVMKSILTEIPKVIEEFYGQNPQESTDYPKIISTEHFDRLINVLKGKQVAYGGTYDRDSLYIQPTVVINVTPNDVLMHDETYGPILPIITINNMNEAVAFITAREKPLALYIFSKNDKVVEHFLENTSSGGVTVNDVLMHIAAESLPFGGVGASGFGSYHGKATFDTFTHSKSVLKKPLNLLVEKIDGSIRYPPYNDKKLFLLTQLMKKRCAINFDKIYFVIVFLLGIVFGFFIAYI